MQEPVYGSSLCVGVSSAQTVWLITCRKLPYDAQGPDSRRQPGHARPGAGRRADGAMAYGWGVDTFLSGVTHTGRPARSITRAGGSAKKIGLFACSKPFLARTTGTPVAERRPFAAARARQARRRLDWAHQQTAVLAGKYALAAMEELALRNMTRSAAGTVQAP